MYNVYIWFWPTLIARDQIHYSVCNRTAGTHYSRGDADTSAILQGHCTHLPAHLSPLHFGHVRSQFSAHLVQCVLTLCKV